MPGIINARPTHSHDAMKTNQSTNNDMNTISSDRTLNDGQKKGGEGRINHKNRRQEVAPVVHEAMVSHVSLFL